MNKSEAFPKIYIKFSQKTRSLREGHRRIIVNTVIKDSRIQEVSEIGLKISSRKIIRKDMEECGHVLKQFNELQRR
jgi:hypothetical protein